MKLALNRYRAQHGKLPPEEEQESWRKEIMNQLGMGDVAPLGANVALPTEVDNIELARQRRRRAAHLKKALTETKIRAKIRRIIKEAE